MMTLLKEGGLPMLPILLFGLITFLSAMRFAQKGDRRRLGFILGMGSATLLMIGAGMCAAIAAVGHHASVDFCARLGMSLSRCVMTGVAESLAPGILGLTLLSLAALFTAIGMSRSKPEAG